MYSGAMTTTTGTALDHNLARIGAQLAGYAHLTERAITCTSHSCLTAAEHSVCNCTCGGTHDHGAITKQRAEVVRARFNAKVDRVHGGDVFRMLPGGGNPDADLDALFGPVSGRRATPDQLAAILADDGFDW